MLTTSWCAIADIRLKFLAINFLCLSYKTEQTTNYWTNFVFRGKTYVIHLIIFKVTHSSRINVYILKVNTSNFQRTLAGC